MPNEFHRGATIKCIRNVKDITTGEYCDPATSMKITITDFQNSAEVDNQDMLKDDTGKYHYNWTSNADSLKGRYSAIYTATDGSDIAIKIDTFELV